MGLRAQELYLVDRNPFQPTIPAIHHSIVPSAEQTAVSVPYLWYFSPRSMVQAR